jgi:hypothetical protein
MAAIAPRVMRPELALEAPGDPFRAFRGLTAWGHAFLFTAVVLALPWDTLAIGVYEDFDVYALLLHPAAETAREMYGPFGPIDYFTREILWADGMAALGRLFGDSVPALLCVSAFVLFTHSLVLFRRYPALLCWILLFNPLFLVFGLAQLRLAFATALLLIALEWGRRLPQLLLVVAAMFVHSAVPLFLAMFAVVRWVEHRGDRIRWPELLALAGGSMLVFVVMLSSGRDVVLGALGDRRAGTYDAISPESLRVVIFWGGFLAVQLASGLDYLRRPDNLFAFQLVGLFVGLTLLSTYGSRFVAAGFVVVAAAAMNLRGGWRIALLGTFIAYQIVQYWYWMGFHLGR